VSAAASDDLVHAPLAHWARSRGDVVALADSTSSLTFAQLHEAVQRSAQALDGAQAPATLFVDEHAGTMGQLVDFLAIVASGRCAAVGDPDWTPSVRKSARSLFSDAPAPHRAPAPNSPFYVGFTSGSTGLPKGFQRDHRSWTESFRACRETFGPGAAARVLAPGRISHSLFLFGMVLGLWSGAGVIVQDRFAPARTLALLRRGDTPCLVAVPSQLAMMLDHAARRRPAPIEGVELIMISGARWMRHRTPELKALFPGARVVEFYGASETSFIAWMDADEAAPPQAVGQPFHNVQIDVRERDATGAGLIFVRSPMLFTDYVGPADPTAALRDGPWLSVRDIGWQDETGRLFLAGRQHRMVVTQGKNLFPEEVESVLCAHPAVATASVHGLPDPVRGQQVVAIVQPRLGQAPGAGLLAAHCRRRLEPFKAPRRFFTCEAWPQTASGKTDHPRLAQALQSFLDAPDGASPSCLRPLP